MAEHNEMPNVCENEEIITEARNSQSITAKQVSDVLRQDFKALDERAADVRRMNDALDKRMAEASALEMNASKKMLEADERSQKVLQRENAMAAQEKMLELRESKCRELEERYMAVEERGKNFKELKEARSLRQAAEKVEDSGEEGDVDTAEDASVASATMAEHRAKLSLLEGLNNDLRGAGPDPTTKTIHEVYSSGYDSSSGIHPEQDTSALLLRRTAAARQSSHGFSRNGIGHGKKLPSIKADTPVTSIKAGSIEAPDTPETGMIDIFFTPAAHSRDLPSTEGRFQVPFLGLKTKLFKRNPTEDELMAREKARGETVQKSPLDQVVEVRKDVKKDTNVFRPPPPGPKSPNSATFSHAHTSTGSPSLKVVRDPSQEVSIKTKHGSMFTGKAAGMPKYDATSTCSGVKVTGEGSPLSQSTRVVRNTPVPAFSPRFKHGVDGAKMAEDMKKWVLKDPDNDATGTATLLDALLNGTAPVATSLDKATDNTSAIHTSPSKESAGSPANAPANNNISGSSGSDGGAFI